MRRRGAVAGRPPFVDEAEFVRGDRQDVDVRRAGDDQKGPRLWRDQDDRSLKPAERQLLDAIAAGELDGHLVALADAVQARRDLLHTVSSAAALAELCVGDTVMFNRRIRPRYLEREVAVVTEVDERWVTVRLWRPVGRFREGVLRCPPLALRKLERAGAATAA